MSKMVGLLSGFAKQSVKMQEEEQKKIDKANENMRKMHMRGVEEQIKRHDEKMNQMDEIEKFLNAGDAQGAWALYLQRSPEVIKDFGRTKDGKRAAGWAINSEQTSAHLRDIIKQTRAISRPTYDEEGIRNLQKNRAVNNMPMERFVRNTLGLDTTQHTLTAPNRINYNVTSKLPTGAEMQYEKEDKSTTIVDVYTGQNTKRKALVDMQTGDVISFIGQKGLQYKPTAATKEHVLSISDQYAKATEAYRLDPENPDTIATYEFYKKRVEEQAALAASGKASGKAGGEHASKDLIADTKSTVAMSVEESKQAVRALYAADRVQEALMKYQMKASVDAANAKPVLVNMLPPNGDPRQMRAVNLLSMEAAKKVEGGWTLADKIRSTVGEARTATSGELNAIDSVVANLAKSGAVPKLKEIYSGAQEKFQLSLTRAVADKVSSMRTSRAYADKDDAFLVRKALESITPRIERVERENIPDELQGIVDWAFDSDYYIRPSNFVSGMKMTNADGVEFTPKTEEQYEAAKKKGFN